MYGIFAIHEVYIQLDCVEGVSKLWNCDEWLTVGDYGILAVVIANSCISVTNGYGRNAVASYD